MTLTEVILYIIVPISLLVSVILFFLKQKPKKQIVSYDEILQLFNNENIIDVEHIRNKVVLNTKNHKLIDLDALKVLGVTGITVVGNKIKFYFQDDAITKDLFNQIKSKLER